MIVSNYCLPIVDKKIVATPPTCIGEIAKFKEQSEIAAEANVCYETFQRASEAMIKADSCRQDLNPNAGVVVLEDTQEVLGYPGQAAIHFDPTQKSVKKFEWLSPDGTRFLNYEMGEVSNGSVNLRISGNLANIVYLS